MSGGFRMARRHSHLGIRGRHAARVDTPRPEVRRKQAVAEEEATIADTARISLTQLAIAFTPAQCGVWPRAAGATGGAEGGCPRPLLSAFWAIPTKRRRDAAPRTS